MELANKYEDYFYFLNEEYNKDGIKQAKDCVKQILEEIYNKGYEDGFGYLIDGKEAKPEGD